MDSSPGMHIDWLKAGGSRSIGLTVPNDLLEVATTPLSLIILSRFAKVGVDSMLSFSRFKPLEISQRQVDPTYNIALRRNCFGCPPTWKGGRLIRYSLYDEDSRDARSFGQSTA